MDTSQFPAIRSPLLLDSLATVGGGPSRLILFQLPLLSSPPIFKLALLPCFLMYSDDLRIAWKSFPLFRYHPSLSRDRLSLSDLPLVTAPFRLAVFPFSFFLGDDDHFQKRVFFSALPSFDGPIFPFYFLLGPPFFPLPPSSLLCQSCTCFRDSPFFFLFDDVSSCFLPLAFTFRRLCRANVRIGSQALVDLNFYPPPLFLPLAAAGRASPRGLQRALHRHHLAASLQLDAEVSRFHHSFTAS